MATAKKKIKAPARKRNKDGSHDYPEAEKLACMMYAVEYDAPQASEKFDVPIHTIFSWFKDAGGLRAVRDYQKERLDAGIFDAKLAVVGEVIRRIEDLNDSQLGAIFLRLLGVDEEGNALAPKERAQNILYIVGAVADGKVPRIESNGGGPIIDVFD